MAIRRRRKTLTNLLSTMERRVTKVELRPINLLTASQVAGAVGGDDALDEGPSAVVSLNAPNQYKPITDGYYYSSNVTGTKPRVELYFNGDPGLAVDKTIRISGINKLFKNSNGTGPIDFDISKDFKVLNVDEPPYDTDRNTYNGKRDTPAETVDSTATFNPGIDNQYSTKRKLAVKARISTVQATTNIATIVFSEPHYFTDNQIIYVDLPDTQYFGIDGLFRIEEVVNSTTIKYAFDASLAEPINLANITEERYVHAVAQSAIRDGATWFDTSQNPDVAYVWDDYRWVLFGSSNVADDDMPPGPITNLTATDKNDTPAGSGEPRVEVTLEWEAPTQNEDGTPLVDLYGYKVQYKQYEGDGWKTAATVTETTWSRGGFLPAKPSYFRVFAVDSGLNESEPVGITHTTSNPQPEVQKPKAPTVTTYLGTIKIAYDDLTASGFAQPGTAKEIEVYFSQQSGFTPGPTNYYGKFPANAGSYIIIPGTELTDGIDYYIKLIVRDVYGNITEPSEQVSIKAKLSDIVTFDMIDVGTLTGQVIIGLDMRTSSNPSVNGGIIMNQQGITAYNPSGTQTFRVSAATGAVTIGEYLRTDQAAGLYLGKNVADGLYATKPSNGTYITDIQAGSIYLSQTSASTNYITKLDAGTLYIGKGNAATDINDNVTEISGGKIKTGTLSASKITSGTLDAGLVTVSDISASNIDRGTLSGRPVQTGSSGKRIVLSATNSRVDIYATSTQSGYLQGESTGLVMSSSGSDCAVEVRPAAVVISGSSTSNRATFGGSGNYTFNGPARTEGGSFIVQAIRAPVSKAYVFVDTSGSLTWGTSTVGVSDERLKKEISSSNIGLNLIEKLNPVTFKWSDIELGDAEQNPLKTKTQLGLVAQQVKSALEDLGLNDTTALLGKYDSQEFYKERLTDIDVDSEPILALDYLQLVPVLIKSIQELSARIENLETEREN